MDDATQVGAAVEGGLDFVSADQIRAAADKAELDPAATAALVEDNSKAQLGSLKVGLLTTALLARRAWRLIRTAEVSSFCCAVPSHGTARLSGKDRVAFYGAVMRDSWPVSNSVWVEGLFYRVVQGKSARAQLAVQASRLEQVDAVLEQCLKSVDDRGGAVPSR